MITIDCALINGIPGFGLNLYRASPACKRNRPAQPIGREFSGGVNSDSLIAQRFEGVSNESMGCRMKIVAHSGVSRACRQPENRSKKSKRGALVFTCPYYEPRLPGGGKIRQCVVAASKWRYADDFGKKDVWFRPPKSPAILVFTRKWRTLSPPPPRNAADPWSIASPRQIQRPSGMA